MGFMALFLSPPVSEKKTAAAVQVQSQPASPTQMEIYLRVKSAIDLTREELLQTYIDELQDIAFDENPEELEPILLKAGTSPIY
jgi:hypothetical protein